jgi:dynactin-5
VLAPDTVVPPFAMFGGSPGVLICELPECTPELFQEMATNAFERFKPRPKT